MGASALGWATQLLVWLLRDGDGLALLGDLAEEHARRLRAGGSREAMRWYRNQVYASLTAVLRRRLLEWARAVPWGTAATAYTAVAVLEFGSVWLLSLLWPGTAHATSALRLVLEFPGIVAIAYVATTVQRSAAFALGGFMLGVAVLMLSLSAEAVSVAFAIAMLTVGPIASVMGWLLHRQWRAVAAGMALLIVTGSAHAQGAITVADRTNAGYGEVSSGVPQERV
jgi:hypothetical protein